MNTLHFNDAQKLTRPTAFSTMIKPVGSLCNLDCDYCYYLGKANLYGGQQPKMSEELLERYISQYIEAVQVSVVTFCWHGGEPLLAGLDFYEKAVTLHRPIISWDVVPLLRRCPRSILLSRLHRRCPSALQSRGWWKKLTVSGEW